MRKLLRIFFICFFRLLTRLTVTGIKNIPLEGGCILTNNHLGIADGPLIFSLIRRNDATGLVAKKHQNNPPIRWIVNTAQGIWIDRTRTDFQALKDAHAFLRNGGLLGISPEGTRSKTGSLIEPKPGVSYLAAKLDVPIIPMAITGTENTKAIFLLRRPKVSVTIGEPFRLSPLDRKNREDSLKRNTDEIMCRIAAMLPYEYRGVYADHARLRYLLGMDVSPKPSTSPKEGGS